MIHYTVFALDSGAVSVALQLLAFTLAKRHFHILFSDDNCSSNLDSEFRLCAPFIHCLDIAGVKN